MKETSNYKFLQDIGGLIFEAYMGRYQLGNWSFQTNADGSYSFNFILHKNGDK